VKYKNKMSMLLLQRLLLLLPILSAAATYRNTTTLGAELLVDTTTTDGLNAEFSDQKYITSWISSSTVQIRWAVTPAHVRNSSIVVIMKEEDWIAHRQGLHNKSCINGYHTHFIPGCSKKNIHDCLTEQGISKNIFFFLI
jgi:hypothetical protein